jgi:hypothetical protein
MNARRRAFSFVLVVGVALPTWAWAAAPDGADAPPACDVPAAERAPDARCGEALDGRGPDAAARALTVPRAVLWVPRLASRALFWPVLQAGGFVESHHLPGWYEAILTSDDGLVGVRPVLHYSTGFLPSGGLRAFYRRLPAGSGVGAAFQTAGPAVLLGELDVAGPTWSGVMLRGVFSRRSDRLYAGIGPNSEAELAARGEGLSRFGSDIFLAELRWAHALPARFVAGAHADLQRRDYRGTDVRGGPPVGDLYDPALIPGFGGGLRVAHAGATIVWDARDHDRDGSGVSAMVDATVGQGLAGDASRHIMTSAEVVGSLGDLDRAVIVRGRAAAVRRLSDAPVPFEELVLPAGPLGLRGFAEGRFRGESGVVASAEYRWYIASRVDASLFTDVGTVAGPGFSGLGQARWFPDFGVGLRLFSRAAQYWEGSVQTGIQLAYAPDGGFRTLFTVAAF